MATFADIEAVYFKNIDNDTILNVMLIGKCTQHLPIGREFIRKITLEPHWSRTYGFGGDPNTHDQVVESAPQ